MLRVLKSIVGFLFTALVATAVWLYSGAYAVGADEPHWPLTVALIDMARERAIGTRAALVSIPADVADPARLQRGAGNYDAMCAQCHLKPGLASSELSRGLYPQPPDFTARSEYDEDAAESAANFWVIKHGIKASGMPAWGQAGVDDEAIWDMVALIGELPSMSARDYHELVESSAGHSHTGADHPHGPADAVDIHGMHEAAADEDDHEGADGLSGEEASQHDHPHDSAAQTN